MLTLIPSIQEHTMYIFCKILNELRPKFIIISLSLSKSIIYFQPYLFSSEFDQMCLELYKIKFYQSLHNNQENIVTLTVDLLQFFLFG